MALDERSERHGVIGVLPPPDGQVDRFDRRTVAWVYPLGSSLDVSFPNSSSWNRLDADEAKVQLLGAQSAKLGKQGPMKANVRPTTG